MRKSQLQMSAGSATDAEGEAGFARNLDSPIALGYYQLRTAWKQVDLM